MAINLPQPGNIFLPKVPASIRQQSSEIADYLENLRRSLLAVNGDVVANDLLIATAINSGTTGTFAISSGGSIVVTSGIVINVTS